MKYDFKTRFTNVWFYVAIVGTILAAAGIDPITMDTWEAVGQALLALVLNPFRLGTVAIALLGDFYNPSTKGLSD